MSSFTHPSQRLRVCGQCEYFVAARKFIPSYSTQLVRVPSYCSLINGAEIERTVRENDTRAARCSFFVEATPF